MSLKLLTDEALINAFIESIKLDEIDIEFILLLYYEIERRNYSRKEIAILLKKPSIQLSRQLICCP